MPKRIWPDVPKDTYIYGMAQVEILQDHRGKPVLVLKFGDTIIYLSANTAEMIGGAAIGARKRYEDFNKS